MADIIDDLASKSNISPELAKKGLGTVLSLLKHKLPEGVYSSVQSAIPGAEGMMQEAGEGQEESSSGVLSAVAGMASKLFGGGGGAGELLSKLSSAGFSAEQLEKFLPNVLEFLKTKLPGDALKQVSSIIPTPEKAGT